MTLPVTLARGPKYRKTVLPPARALGAVRSKLVSPGRRVFVESSLVPVTGFNGIGVACTRGLHGNTAGSVCVAPVVGLGFAVGVEVAGGKVLVGPTPGVSVATGVWVDVGSGVMVAVTPGTGVDVGVAVLTGAVFVGMAVFVEVGTLVDVSVAEGVGVSVGIGVFVGVAVFVGVGASTVYVVDATSGDVPSVPVTVIV